MNVFHNSGKYYEPVGSRKIISNSFLLRIQQKNNRTVFIFFSLAIQKYYLTLFSVTQCRIKFHAAK